jgi:hypothetical protein
MSENMYKLQYELNIQPCNCIKYGTSWFQIIQSSISYCNNFYSNLTPIIFSDDPMAVPSFLHEHKLLPDSCECTHCKKPMVLRKRPTKDTMDGNASLVNVQKDLLPKQSEQAHSLKDHDFHSPNWSTWCTCGAAKPLSRVQQILLVSHKRP